MRGALWVIPILALMAYSMGIFWITSWAVLYWIMIAHVALIAILRISPWKLLKNTLFVIPFIAFTGLINWAFADLESSLLIMARIFLLCNMTFIFSQAVTIMNFVRGLRVFLGRNIAVTTAVAITFIPILNREYRRIREGINARGRKRGFRIATRIFAFRILYRASVLSDTLEAKGYK